MYFCAVTGDTAGGVCSAFDCKIDGLFLTESVDSCLSLPLCSVAQSLVFLSLSVPRRVSLMHIALFVSRIPYLSFIYPSKPQ